MLNLRSLDCLEVVVDLLFICYAKTFDLLQPLLVLCLLDLFPLVFGLGFAKLYPFKPTLHLLLRFCQSLFLDFRLIGGCRC